MNTDRSPLPNWGEGQGEGNIDAILRNTTQTLTNYSDAPYLDAQRIVLHVLKKHEPSYLLAHATDMLSSEQMQEIIAMADERKTGKPLAYILGEADFYGRTFIVTPDVLIPRPDTEMFIEKTLEYVKKNFTDKEESVLADICTGSGIIAITLALELSSKFPVVRCKFIATDISKAALAIAKQNAEKHGVADSIEFIEGDMLSPIKNRHIDLIVSNPPYISTKEIESIYRTPKQYLRNSKERPWNEGLLFEPRIALDGGIDGQKFINQIKASGIPSIIETTGGEIIQI